MLFLVQKSGIKFHKISLIISNCKFWPTKSYAKYIHSHRNSVGTGYRLTHWGWVTHICVGNLTIIGSHNGLSPGRRQAIIWTNAGILLIEPLGTNFSENLIRIHTFSFKKTHLKMASGKWRPFCLGLTVLRVVSTESAEALVLLGAKVSADTIMTRGPFH